MGNAKSNRKKAECKQHRQMVCDAVLDDMLDAIKEKRQPKYSPEYLHERSLKLKEVK